MNPLADFYPVLYVAASNENFEMAELLIRHGAQVNGLRWAATRRKRYAMMEFLFRHGANVNDNTKECDEVVIGRLPGRTARCCGGRC